MYRNKYIIYNKYTIKLANVKKKLIVYTNLNPNFKLTS